jgi:hypothetical protein
LKSTLSEERSRTRQETKRCLSTNSTSSGEAFA